MGGVSFFLFFCQFLRLDLDLDLCEMRFEELSLRFISLSLFLSSYLCSHGHMLTIFFVLLLACESSVVADISPAYICSAAVYSPTATGALSPFQ